MKTIYVPFMIIFGYNFFTIYHKTCSTYYYNIDLSILEFILLNVLTNRFLKSRICKFLHQYVNIFSIREMSIYFCFEKMVVRIITDQIPFAKSHLVRNINTILVFFIFSIRINFFYRSRGTTGLFFSKGLVQRL